MRMEYNKKDSLRRKDNVYGGHANIVGPTMDVEEIKRLLAGGTPDISKYGMTFADADKKVAAALKDQKSRYESGLVNLNDRLTQTLKQVDILKKELDILTTENIELKTREDKYLTEINLLRAKVNNNLTSDVNSSNELSDIKKMLVELLSGKNSVVEAVELEKVFINPVDDNKQLDSYIKVETTSSESSITGEDVKHNLNKLKTLLVKRS